MVLVVVALRFVGTAIGRTVFDKPDAGPVPIAFVAFTVNE